MALQFSGIDGALFLDSVKIAKVTEWTFAGAVDALDCSTLGDFARKYVHGMQSFSGSCTILYYEKDGGEIEGAQMLDSVIRTRRTPTEPSHTLDLRYENGAKTHSVKFTCLLNNVSITSRVGEIARAAVQFTVSGPLQTASLV